MQTPRVAQALCMMVLGVLLCACTSRYKPVSAWEEKVFSQADFSVYPEDVRREPTAYAGKLVAWPGVLKTIDFADHPTSPTATFVVEHHYFDWITDRGAQRAIYFLSPRGEGLFRATWPMKKEWDLAEMRKLILPGQMMIVYGHPKGLQDEMIDLGQAAYARAIPKDAFTTEILDYGRRVSPPSAAAGQD